MSDQRHIFRGFSWLVAGYAGRTLAFVALTVILTHSLEPAAFGRLSIFLALAAGIGALAGSWPFLSVPMLVGSGRDMASAFMPALLLAGGLGVVLSLLSIPFSKQLLPQGGAALIPLVSYATALVALQGVYAVLQTQGRMRVIAGAQTAERMVAVVVVASVALAGGLTVARAEASLAIAAALACVGTAFLALRSEPILTPMTSARLRSGVADLLGAVGPFAIVSVCAYLIAWIDVLLLALYASDRIVGHYALAYQLFTVVLQTASLWIVAALPAHAAAATRDPAALRLKVRTARPMVALWSGAVAIFAVGVAIALTAVFGADYREALKPSLALLASAPPLAGYFVAVPILMAQSRGRELAIVALTGAVLNVGLDLALIPRMGIWGPVVATLTVNGASSIAILVLLVAGRAALRILVVSLPACATIGFLATSPDSSVAMGTAVLVSALGVGVWLKDRRAK